MNERKITMFLSALKNVYRDENDKEEIEKLDLHNSDITEDFTSMVIAIMAFYIDITGDECDPVNFVGIVNKLIFQAVIGEKENIRKKEK